MRAEVDCVFRKPKELVAKVYADGATGPIAQETVKLTKRAITVDLKDKPTFASVALLCAETGDVLDEKNYREGGWREPEIELETSKQEIEQMLLLGESETVDFREIVKKGEGARLAKTTVAFANTKGGTIVVGVDDDLHVVGCETKGLGDTVTNMLRSLCDEPVPSFTTETLSYQGKRLFLIRVAESKGPIHTAKEQGPFIRANGSDRRPTSQELEYLNRRRGSLSTVFPGHEFIRI